MNKKKLGNWRLGVASLLMAGMVAAGAGSANAAVSYTTGDNDTFWKLSKKFGVPVQTLMAANPKVNPLNMYAGLKLTIPSTGGTTVKAASSATTVKTLSTGNAAARAALIASAVPGQAAQAPKTYFKSFQVKATAYTAAHEENGWGPVDYFGNSLKIGTVAVDPKVIALGTKLYIEGYDYDGLPAGGMYAIATDTGSAIKGKRIDIFVPDSRSKAKTFAYQTVKVYML